MAQQIPVGNEALFGFEVPEEGGRAIAPDLAYRRLAMVNVVFSGRPDDQWVLVDAGLRGTAGMIEGSGAARFGAGRPPAAIVLTHGHIDHVGALHSLAQQWDVPIYAHVLEHPYLNGQSAYPKPDTGVGGGMMSRLAALFPRGPLDVSDWLRPLPADGSVPSMPGWCWIHTPGHAAGHVSLWREADRTLIAGDAFHHHGAGIRLRGRHAGARVARAADVFHRRFPDGRGLGSAIGGAGAGNRCLRPWSCHARAGDARGAAPARGKLRTCRRAPARTLRHQSRSGGRWLSLSWTLRFVSHFC